MQWKDIFKQKNTSEEEKVKRDQSNPHFSLVCGIILTRGSNNFKKRHWQSKHPNEPPENFEQMLVHQDHVKS